MSTNPYVFVSYAHKNSKLVLPAIAQLQSQGIEIWYDSGIEAGSEWPEFVAEKVLNCNKFLLFISQSYLESQNCKRELNFAISRKKEILSVFIENVSLTPGMEMQLGTYQAIFANRFPNKNALYTSLSKEPFFDTCRTRSAYTEFQPATTHSTAASTLTQSSNFQGENTAATQQPPLKRKIIAILLAFFLGAFGAHKFYLKQTKRGIVYLLFFWTYIPLFLSLAECLYMIFISRERFEQKYNCQLK